MQELLLNSDTWSVIQPEFTSQALYTLSCVSKIFYSHIWKTLTHLAFYKHISPQQALQYFARAPTIQEFLMTKHFDPESLTSLQTLPNLTRVRSKGINLSHTKWVEKLTNLRQLSTSDMYDFKDKHVRSYQGLVNLTKLNVSNTGITGKTLVYLKNLKKLECLKLSFCTNIQVEHWYQMTALASLKAVDLAFLDVQPDMTTVQALTNLENLKIYCSQVNQDLPLLGGLTNLTGLELGNNPFKRGFEYLTRLTGLTALCVRRGRIDPSHLLPHLAHFTRLKTLNLDGMAHPVTDQFACAFQPLTNLSSLSIGSHIMSDDALIHLRPLTKLQHLNIYSPNPLGPGLVHISDSVSSLYIRLKDTQFLSHLTNLITLNCAGEETEPLKGEALHPQYFRQLRYLRFSHPIFNASFSSLSILTDLRALHWTNLHTADEEAFLTLSLFTSLISLNLCFARHKTIDGTFLSHLTTLTRLERMDLPEGSYTEDHFLPLKPLATLGALRKISSVFITITRQDLVNLQPGERLAALVGSEEESI